MSSNGKIHQALAFCERGDFRQAGEVCRNIIKSRPNNADALHILGLVALETRDYTAAVQLLGRVVKINPRYVPALVNRGSAYQALGQCEAALDSYAQALALDASIAEAHYNCGVVLQRLHREEEALACYDNAVALRPDIVDAHLNRALLLHELNRIPAALAGYDRALALQPNLAAASLGRANALFELGNLNAALAAFDRTIALTPDDAIAHCNRGNVLREQRLLDAALASYDRAIALRDDLAVAHMNRGNILSEFQLWEPALASYDRAIALSPDYAEARFCKGMTQLLLEDFDDGWVNYEWRLKLKRGPEQRVTDEERCRDRRWNGKDPIAGKRILVRCEQGFGDTIQFCRYVTLLAGAGSQVMLEVQPALLKLLQPLRGASQVFEPGTAAEFDYQIPLLSLPMAFRTQSTTIPAATRYLETDPAKVSAWERKLGTRVMPRVGLVWRGKVQRGDNRSAELSDLVASLPAGFQYVCLQKEIPKTDSLMLEKHGIMNASTELHDFSDTAALCDCMDVVISIDTGIAHLSAALGRPTWVLLATYPDWRWSRSGTACAWYSTAKLYRQSAPSAWGELYSRVFADLVAISGVPGQNAVTTT